MGAVNAMRHHTRPSDDGGLDRGRVSLFHLPLVFIGVVAALVLGALTEVADVLRAATGRWRG